MASFVAGITPRNETPRFRICRKAYTENPSVPARGVITGGFFLPSIERFFEVCRSASVKWFRLAPGKIHLTLPLVSEQVRWPSSKCCPYEASNHGARPSYAKGPSDPSGHWGEETIVSISDQSIPTASDFKEDRQRIRRSPALLVNQAREVSIRGSVAASLGAAWLDEETYLY